MAQSRLHGAVVDAQFDLQRHRGSLSIRKHCERTLGRVARTVRRMQRTDVIPDPTGDLDSNLRKFVYLPVLHEAEETLGRIDLLNPRPRVQLRLDQDDSGNTGRQQTGAVSNGAKQRL